MTYAAYVGVAYYGPSIGMHSSLMESGGLDTYPTFTPTQPTIPTDLKSTYPDKLRSF